MEIELINKKGSLFIIKYLKIIQILKTEYLKHFNKEIL